MAPKEAELSKVLTLSISSEVPSHPKNASSEDWKTGFLPHDSKNRRSFDIFPNDGCGCYSGCGGYGGCGVVVVTVVVVIPVVVVVKVVVVIMVVVVFMVVTV